MIEQAVQAPAVARCDYGAGRRLLYVVNESYFFLSHRLALARAAQAVGFDVHVAAPEDHVWAPADFSNQVLASHGFTYHPVPVSRRGTSLVEDLATFTALHALYRRLRPDLLHHLTIKPNLYGGIAARLTRVPAVVSAVTGMGQVFVATDQRSRLLRAVLVPMLRVALNHRNGRVILQNPDDRDRIVSSGIATSGQCQLIRGAGVDLEQFQPQPEPATGPPLVILPSRLIWEKGVAEFVEAARLLRGRGSAVRFALVGDTQPSNPRSVPAAQLTQWHQQGLVEWWGRREDMPAVFARSHIVCLPSSYGEGVPKVLIEAAACGRAIVTTNHPGCREVVRHEVNGLLVAPGDATALADALHRLCQDARLRAQFGEAGRARVEKEFGLEAVVQRTLEVYQDLVRPVPSRAATAAPDMRADRI